MKVDKRATAAAQARHVLGVKRLNELFAFARAKVPFNAQTGRALATPAERRAYREWRDSTFPERPRRRRRRRLARASRKKNR